MNISLNTLYMPCFNAKKKEIREADDIQRRVTLEFPRFSTTYADKFYLTTDTKKYSAKKNKLEFKLKGLRQSVCVEEFFDSIPHRIVLEKIKKSKLANCGEISKAVLSALYANGIYDSDRYSLVLKTKFTNKNTNFTEYETTKILDHVFVISSMNKNSKDTKDNVVIDGWLNFAGSISEAKEKFKKLYSPSYLNMIFESQKKDFKKVKANMQKDLDFSDYKISSKIEFEKEEELPDYKKRILGNYIKEKYPELVIKKPQNNQSNF